MIIRKTKLNSVTDIQTLIKSTGCDSRAVENLSKKVLGEIFIIDNIDNRAANILKQEALSVGADIAVSENVSRFKKGVSKAVLFGNVKNIERLLNKLKLQPFGLSKLKTEIEPLLKPQPCCPKIMGIINLDPNSFSGGHAKTPEDAAQIARQMQRDGASIIDLGAVTSKPSSRQINAKEEIKRLMPALKAVRKISKLPLSVDTFEPETAKAALSEGADIINDIYGLRKHGMAQVIAKAKAKVIIMHMQGTPHTMQRAPKYKDVVLDVFNFLNTQINFALESAIDKKNILADVGIGFGKSLRHNYALLKSQNDFKSLNVPLVLGISRKSLISNALGTKDNTILDAQTAALSALTYGAADILRVHNVKYISDTLKIINLYKDA
jgi:dihydropteroate synthase